ncbi:hypothetical protein CCP3SC5AM1_1440002 [Gammaproteobacteria bacterium]
MTLNIFKFKASRPIIPLIVFILINHAARGADALDWAVRCETEGERRCYLVQNVLLAENQERLASLALTGQGEEIIALAGAPLGVNLPAAIQLQVDDGQPVQVPYQVCDAQGCRGAVVLSTKFFKAMKKGNKFTLSYQDTTGRRIGVPLSLNGLEHGLGKLKSAEYIQ